MPPRRPNENGTNITRVNQVAARTFKRNPGRYNLQSNLTIKSGTAVAEADDTAERGAQKLLRQGGGQENWELESSVRILPPNQILPSEYLAEYQEFFSTGQPRQVNNLNLHILNAKPNFDKFVALKSDGTKILRNGEPFIVWEWFHKILADLCMEFFSAYAFPKGSFYQVAIMNENNDVLTNFISFDQPNEEYVEQELKELEATPTSGGQAFKEGSYLQLIVYNPGTGREGELPAHLKNKPKTVWNPPGSYCAAKCIAVLCADKDRIQAPSRLKHLKERPSQLDKAIEPLLRHVCEDPDWTYFDIEKAAKHLGINITILDVYSYAIVYDTADSREKIDGIDSDSESDEDSSDDEGIDEDKRRIYMLHDRMQNHYIACFKPDALDSNKRWCGSCRKLYCRTKPHTCSAFACKFCKQNHDTKKQFIDHFYNHDVERVCCKVCNKEMPESCCKIHEPECKGISVKCATCGEIYINANNVKNPRAITPEQHMAMCGMRMKYCVICDEHLEKDHRCKITRKNFAHDFEKPAPTTYAIDIEAASDKGKQVVTFVSVREIADMIEGETDQEYLERNVQFQKDTAPLSFYSLRDFCLWAAVQKNSLFVAHNGSGYDFVLIHNFFRYELGVKTEVTNVGLKVMFFKWGTCRMIDSLNHIRTSLASFPKVLGIQIDGLKKDVFPHLFNTIDNRGYKGVLPDINYFDIENSTEDPELMKKWYEENEPKYRDGSWDLNKVEEEYCHQDTYVLAVCWGYYVYTSILLTEVNPAKSPTTAGYCMRVYRHAHIPEELDGIPTLTEYERKFAAKGFHGGRTETFCKSYETKPGEKIVGYDVCSLYPAVQWYDGLCYGAPKILKGEQVPPNWLDMHGFAEVDITPPTFSEDDPFFKPVIGSKSKEDGKFTFDLYPKEKEVVTTHELRECVKQGYVINKVHEFHQYEMRDDLFKTYIRTFLKIKVESGDPPEEDIEKFCDVYKREFDIELDRVKLLQPKNKGMYQLAKNCLNNLWGKFGMNVYAASVLVDAEGFHKIVQRHLNKNIVLKTVHIDPFLEDAFAMDYEDFTKCNINKLLCTNLALAADVTARARMRLYQLLGNKDIKLKLYCDTDSLFFVIGPEGVPDSVKHLIGGKLGQWELEGQWPERDGFTGKFVSYAAKLYALSDNDPENKKNEKVKCKGFKKTNATRDLLSFDNLAKCQTKDADGNYPKVSATYRHFRRQKYGGIFVGKLQKEFAFNPATQKSNTTHRDDGFYVPFSPTTPRPNVEIKKQRKRSGDPLPPVVYEKKLKFGSFNCKQDSEDPENSDNELTELQADMLMEEAIIEQDERRNSMMFLN